MENYLQPYKWTYLNEVVERSGDLKQQTGNFRITNAISQTANPFLYNTFSVSTDPRTLSRCNLEVGNRNEYPNIHYKPSSDLSRFYRDAMSYVCANNDFQGGTLLNRAN